MECQSSDSKKLFKLFETSKRQRSRKNRSGLDDSNSVATDGSASDCHAAQKGRSASAKASLQEMSPSQMNNDASGDCDNGKRDRGSSPDLPKDAHRTSRSPRRHRRSQREGVSLALKAGLMSTPRSSSPRQDTEIGVDKIARDQDSFIYAFLEESIKRDKKKARHAKKQEERQERQERQGIHERDVSKERRHNHRRRHEDIPTSKSKSRKEDSPAPPPPMVDQVALFETFAKICAQMNENSRHVEKVSRTLSHKSLQCEVESRREYEIDQRPVRLHSREHSREVLPSPRSRSYENTRGRIRDQDKISANNPRCQDKCRCYYEKDVKYASRLDVEPKLRDEEDVDRYRVYPVLESRTRSKLSGHVPHGRERSPTYSYRDREYDDRRDYRDRLYEEEKKRVFEQKTSRSFDVQREHYGDDVRRTTRSDGIKEKKYDGVREKIFDDSDRREKYYEDRPLDGRVRNYKKDVRHPKRNVDSRFDRNSIASREDDYRDRYSERERDSGLSVADGETSTISGKSNYLRVVKHEIAEQREAMDKMMKLWKELMKCFKGISQPQDPNNKNINESAENARDSAAAQLRLWRECMRRYETVARDVGDTDARLMEEITKQRSEMAEMSTMWQECLQRYREMSSDFNNLKQQLATTVSESPTRMAAPLVCAEGEGSVPPAPYRLPPTYPQMPPMPPYMGGGGGGGSPLRGRASAPPAWQWWGEGPRVAPRRRQSSPESRGSRDRERRHRKDRDRDDSRYNKDKSSKPSAARSEHRHRKR